MEESVEKENVTKVTVILYLNSTGAIGVELSLKGCFRRKLSSFFFQIFDSNMPQVHLYDDDDDDDEKEC